MRGARTARRRPPKSQRVRGSSPLGSISALALLLLLSPAAAVGQEVLIEVRYPRVQRQVLIRASHDSASGALTLPTDPLAELTGEDLPGDRLTLGQLRRVLGPGVRVEYDPNRAVVYIRDPQGQLSAARQARQRRRANSRAQAGVGFQRTAGGPWSVLTADGAGDARVRAGWQLGRVSVFGSHSTIGDPTWGASVQPFGRTYISYHHGVSRDPRLSLRTAPGPAFLSVRADPTDPAGTVSGRAALSVGRWTVFATDDARGALTYDARSFTLTAGGDPRHPRSLTVRLGLGRDHSHLSIPTLR